MQKQVKENSIAAPARLDEQGFGGFGFCGLGFRVQGSGFIV